MSVQSVIKEKIGDIGEKNIHISPEIPEKKLNHAMNKICTGVDITSVVALIDNSLFSDGKEGIVFTGTKMFYREMMSEPVLVEYDTISSATFLEIEKKKEKRSGEIKVTIESVIKIVTTDNEEILLKGFSDFDCPKLSDLITEIAEMDDEHEEVNQILTISEMDTDVKLSYVKIVVNMTYSDDGEVDPKEYAEILSLITKLELTTEERVLLRGYIRDSENLEENKKLIDLIDEKCPAGNERSIHVSLIKDLLNVHKKTKNGKAENCQFIKDNEEVFGVDQDVIELAEKAIGNDEYLLNHEASDAVIKKQMKELTAKASAVGVPVAAVYMSGSVVGLSAAGITSGLATLGLGGFLGFSGMVTGLGVAVLVGLTAYKGVKKLTGSEEVERQKKRESLLQEVIKHTQKTINVLVEDINYISSRLVKEIELGEGHSVQIQKLSMALTLLSSTGTTLKEKSEETEIKALRIRCPKIMNIGRLKSLTSEPSKKAYFENVLLCYEKKPISAEEDKTDGEKFKLRNDLNTKVMKELVETLEVIGYFEIGSIARGKGKQILGSLSAKKENE